MDKYLIRKRKPDEGVSNVCGEVNDAVRQDDARETCGTKRKFKEEWIVLFPWLELRDEKCFCKACNKSLLNHFGHIKRHEQRSFHKKNMALKRNQENLDSYLKGTDGECNLKRQVKAAEMTMVMFCIMHNLSFAIMDYLPKLLGECCPDSKIAVAIHCGRSKSAKIAEKLGKVGKEKILKQIRENKFSLITDETTDISSKKGLVLIVRVFNKSSKMLKDHFLALLELAELNADGIFKAIKAFFRDNCIPLSNLIGIATDNANVMVGAFNSVQSKFREENVDLFCMRCTCHSLHLCTFHACKKLPVSIEKLCKDIFNYFAHSSKRINELKEFQKYCELECHKILGISSTRWLSLENVVNRILEQWNALKLYFVSCTLEINCVRPRDLAEAMDKPENKIYFLFLSYILAIANNLNKEFQSEKVRLPYLHQHMEAAFKLIASNFCKYDYLKSHPITEINIFDDLNYVNYDEIYIGAKAENYITEAFITKPEKIIIKSNILEFYKELLKQLNARFDLKDEKLKHLSLLQPQIALNSNVSILPLINNFLHLTQCDIEILSMQWRLLQSSNFQIDSNLEIDIFWEKVSCIRNAMGEPMFNELSSFVFNLLCLPHSSAAAERKFSEFALIKNKYRNRLEYNTINNILSAKELVTTTKNLHYVWNAKEIM